MGKLKIAYITIYDANDVNNWSGLGYYISKTVEKHLGEVTYIGNLKPRIFISLVIKKLWYKYIVGKDYDSNRSALKGLAYAQLVEKQLKGKHFDLIFCPDTKPIAYLKTNIPIVFWNDANFHDMVDYYFMNLSKETIKDGDLMNKISLKNCALAIYSSDWAANGAIEFYKTNRNKVKVIPFGANISDVPSIDELKFKLNSEIELLFVGVEWERKGGKIAYETMVSLNERGIKTNLTIVGCIPPTVFSDERLKVIPFLNKNLKKDRELLCKLYLESDFFIVPSRKECYGIVFCESAAFGLPVLSTNTGGISTVIQEGVNGYILSLSSEGKSYADKIIEVIENGSYEQLCKSTRQRYDEVLNWDVAGEKLKKEILKII